MSLTNPDKVVTEQRLSEFYGQILPYLGGMPEAVANKFSRSDIYNTSERIVGQWVDGKPIYQKTFVINTTISNGTEIGTIPNLEEVIDVFGFGQLPNTSNNNWIPICYAMVGGGGAEATTVYVDNSTKKLYFVNSRTELNYIKSRFTIRYTKTTDSATAIGVDTDYSTDEKIVGTWIDGKPLYQKTISCGTLPNATTKLIAHTITNLDKIITVNGFAHSTDSILSLPFTSTVSVGANITCYVEGTNIKIITGSNRTVFTVSYVTLQYTKTS